jgi:hypothetical protein
MQAGEGIMRLELSSNLANEDIAPAVTLKHQVQSYRYLLFRMKFILKVVYFYFIFCLGQLNQK